ncbi:MAG: CsiV family protein [Gammaproteobacteria bacterium]|nr:CsiV family protein [Gammaproteobacteria bacterium]
MSRIIVLVLALFAIAPAQAATPDPSSTQSNNYEVELLVFRNFLPGLVGNEQWNQDTVNPVIKGLKQAIDPVPAPPVDSVLSDAAIALSGNPHYQLLLHDSWIESGQTRFASQLMRITASEPGDPDELDGTVRFYINEYMHVVLHLLLKEPAPDTGSSLFDTAPASPILYRLDDERRIRLNEVNYFDHPMFGVLLRVTRAPSDTAPAPAPAAQPAGGSAG